MKAEGKACLCLVACHLLARITKKVFLLSSVHNSTLSLSLHCCLTACGSKYCMGCWHSPFDLTLPLLFSLAEPECEYQDSGTQEEAPAQSVSLRPPPVTLSPSIYTKTAQFLLQNSALQVKARPIWQLDSHWPHINENNLVCTLFLKLQTGWIYYL